MNNQHKSIAFTSETEGKSALSFLNVKISSENKTFITSVCLKPTIPHINSEVNPPHPIVNVACKYLGELLAASFVVASLPTSCNIE